MLALEGSASLRAFAGRAAVFDAAGRELDGVCSRGVSDVFVFESASDSLCAGDPDPSASARDGAAASKKMLAPNSRA